MRTVYRYEIPVDDQPHKLVAPFDPTGLPHDNTGRTCIVHIACRNDPRAVEVWVQVDTELPLDPRNEVHLIVTGTGREAPEGAIHLGTALGPIGAVWHLWRLP